MNFQAHRKRRDAKEVEFCEAVRGIPGRIVTAQTIEGATRHRAQLLPSAGCPDVIAGFNGRTFLVEIKVISTAPKARVSRTSRRELASRFAAIAQRLGEDRARLMSPVQLEWAQTWAGSPVHCVTTAQEFAAVLGLCLRCGWLDSAGLCDRCAE